ncbi:universal stress protein [Geoalkalibacter sp.]|uniref:universal stress protein n=1 Tax=Geoalkalibacter sp. TaxID=3041440 RepID=UPI00272DD52C|nr:universal stress protein [Geoalkalibacter sp.]
MLPKIATILYATDLGAGAPHVFRYALAEAEKHDARIVILHAMEPLSTFGQHLIELHISQQQSERIHRQAREHARKKIEERVQRLCDKEVCHAPSGAGLVGEIRVVEGHPANEIMAQAREVKADLIVMGTHRHTVIGDAVLGHTANKVMHRSEIPVLLVRIPEGYHEEGF